MPSLSPDQVKALLSEHDPDICPECGQRIVKNYCRQCDEFFYAGHEPTCPRMTGTWSDDHAGHRTY